MSSSRLFVPAPNKVKVVCVVVVFLIYFDMDFLYNPLNAKEEQMLVAEARGLRVTSTLQELYPSLVQGPDPVGVGARVIFFTLTFGDCATRDCLPLYACAQRALNIALLALSALALTLLYRNLCGDRNVDLLSPRLFVRALSRINPFQKSREVKENHYKKDERSCIAMSIPASYVCGLFFMIHPLHVETCLTLYSRRDLLVLLCVLTSFAVYTIKPDGSLWRTASVTVFSLSTLALAMVMDRRALARMWIPIFAVFETVQCAAMATHSAKTLGILITLYTLARSAAINSPPTISSSTTPFDVMTHIYRHFAACVSAWVYIDDGRAVAALHNTAEVCDRASRRFLRVSVHDGDVRVLGAASLCLVAIGMSSRRLSQRHPNHALPCRKQNMELFQETDTSGKEKRDFDEEHCDNSAPMNRIFMLLAAHWLFLNVASDATCVVGAGAPAHWWTLALVWLLYPLPPIRAPIDVLKRARVSSKTLSRFAFAPQDDTMDDCLLRSALSRLWVIVFLVVCCVRTKWLLTTWQAHNGGSLGGAITVRQAQAANVIRMRSSNSVAELFDVHKLLRLDAYNTKLRQYTAVQVNHNCDLLLRAVMITRVVHSRCLIARCLLRHNSPGRALIQLVSRLSQLSLEARFVEMSPCIDDEIFDVAVKALVLRLKKKHAWNEVDVVFGIYALARNVTRSQETLARLSNGYAVVDAIQRVGNATCGGPDYLDMAARAVRENRWNATMAVYTDAIRENPLDPMIYYYAGMFGLSMRPGDVTRLNMTQAHFSSFLFDAILLDPAVPSFHLEYCKATSNIFYCENAFFLTGRKSEEASFLIRILKKRSLVEAEKAETFLASLRGISVLVDGMREALSNKIVEAIPGKRFVIMDLWSPLRFLVRKLEAGSCKELFAHDGAWNMYAGFKRQWRDSMRKLLDYTVVERWVAFDNQLQTSCGD